MSAWVVLHLHEVANARNERDHLGTPSPSSRAVAGYLIVTPKRLYLPLGLSV
jgi:hypothetical protein